MSPKPRHQKSASARQNTEYCPSDMRPDILTKVKLAVQLLTVDNVKSVRISSHHVTDLKVKPLMMVIGVGVRVEYKVVFGLPDLQNIYSSVYNQTQTNTVQHQRSSGYSYPQTNILEYKHSYGAGFMKSTFMYF